MNSLGEEGIRKRKELEVETHWAPWLQPPGDRSLALRTGLWWYFWLSDPTGTSGVCRPARHRKLSGWLYYSEHMVIWLQLSETVCDSAELGMGLLAVKVGAWVVLDIGVLAQSFLELVSLQSSQNHLGPRDLIQAWNVTSWGEEGREWPPTVSLLD